MTSDVNKILDSITSAANEVVDEARDVAQTASKALTGHYGSVKLRFELSQLQEKQRDIFAQIGRTLYFVHSGVYSNDENTQEDNLKTPQHNIDNLLLQAAKLDAQIEAVQAQLAKSQNKHICGKCKNACGQNEAFCSACGNALYTEK